MSPRPIVEPTQDQFGADVHPAYGHVKVNRVTAHPGVTLFDSEIKHEHFVVLEVNRASCKRDLSHNWIHAGNKALIEIAMSEAQWAALVSSFGSSGVPCTLTRTETDWQIPAIPFKPVLGESLREVREAADEAFGEIKQALAAYEGTLKGTAKERRAALDHLRATIQNATPNVMHASVSLNKHAENTVQKAKADVEAMVLRKAQELALEPGHAPMLELEQ